jgi:hypothetical protein
MGFDDLRSNMSPIRNIKRRAVLLACLLLGVLTGPVALASGVGATGPLSPAPFPATSVDFVGYGDGPGVGMGQWGAFGYAVLDHEPYSWILDHYYGGTTLSSSDSEVKADPMVSVDINENDGHPVVVTSASPFSFGSHSFAGGQVARAVLSAGTWTLSESTACSSTKWLPVATGLEDPVADPYSLAATASATQVLTICEPSGNEVPVRGTLEAYAAPTGEVTLNFLPLEQYVRAVISAEVSWSWGLFGESSGAPQKEPWGFQALEAQAVATRSYVAAELASGGWEPYATTCDSYCQSYPGMAGETADLDAAVTDTAGQILEQPEAGALTGDAGRTVENVQPAPGGPAGPTQPGVPILAGYSASTGGYTGGGPFPQVVDLGDVVCIKSHYYSCNPCHKWLATVPVSAIEGLFKSIGKLASVEVTERNGLGALGGRVEAVEVLGTTGASVTVPPYELGALLAGNNPDHCTSDWFGVTNGP